MRASVALVLAASRSGCATSWIIVQSTGTQRTLDEGVREVSVPVAGVQERIAVSLPLALEYAPAPTTTTTTPAARTPLPFALSCRTEQQAKDVVYHSAFRYGRRWKWTAGLMFLTEGALASLMMFAVDGKDKQAYQLGGVVLAADALVTGALFFIPRKEIYRHDEKATVTPVRSDCPDGMTLTIAGATFPVDAAGRIGEVGEAALDAWMTAPNGSLVVTVAGQQRALEVGPGEQCTWALEHQRDRPPGCYANVALRSVMTSIPVPVGALSGLAER